jgi:hypothetical protein
LKLRGFISLSRNKTTPGWIALCMLGLSALTLARATLAGTARVDGAGVGLHQLWLGLLWLCFAAAAMRLYLAAVEDGPDLRHVLWAAILIHAAAALALPYSSNDIFSNLAYGRMLRLGINPYLAGPSALPAGDPFLAMVGPRWLDTPSAYGPVNLALNWLAGRADSVAASMVVYKLGAFATSIGTVLAGYAICRRHLEGSAARGAFAFLALNPLLVYEVSGQAHNDGVMVLGLMLFVWAALAERELLAAACLALALYAKFAVAPVFGLYLVFLFRRSPLKAAAAAALVAGLGAVLFLPFWHGMATLAGPLTTISGDVTRVSRSYTDLLCSIGELCGGERGRLWAYRLCWALGTAFLLILAGRAITRVRSVESVLRESLVYLLCYGLIAAPWYLSWYETWLLPLALVDRDVRLRRLVAIYTALSVVQWCTSSAVVQGLVINTVVLTLAYRWFKPAAAAALPVAEAADELPGLGQLEEA